MKMPSSVRYFNKRVLNPVTGKLARSSWGPFCILFHLGRRSGKSYETPIMAFPTADGFIIAMTYGPGTDWYRNIRAAGGCKIQWHGRVYELYKIEPLDAKTALPHLPGIVRTALRLAGLQDFIKLDGQSPCQSSL